MAGFLYFAPVAPTDLVGRDKRVRREVLRRFSLQAVLQDVLVSPDHLVVCAVTSGPDGQPGCTLYPVPPHGDVPDGVGYHVDRQKWTRLESVRGDGGGWIGYWTDHPPTPPDLERREMLPGRSVEDATGRQWLIPIARKADNPRGTLPSSVGFDACGRPQITVAAGWSQFWADSLRLYDLALLRGDLATGGYLLFGHGTTEEEDLFLIDMSLRALAGNYRLDGRVLHVYGEVHLDWLSQLTISRIVNAVIDYQSKREWDSAKKKDAIPAPDAGVSSGTGSPDATEDSVPAVGS